MDGSARRLRGLRLDGPCQRSGQGYPPHALDQGTLGRHVACREGGAALPWLLPSLRCKTLV